MLRLPLDDLGGIAHLHRTAAWARNLDSHYSDVVQGWFAAEVEIPVRHGEQPPALAAVSRA